MVMINRNVIALAALVGLSGCLYLDGINESPKVRMVLVTDQELIYIGERVWVDARDTVDPDGDLMTYLFTIEHEGSTDDPEPELCPVYMEPWELCFIPGADVTYNITLRVTDEHGAVSVGQLVGVHPNNRPPVVDCRIDTFAKPNNHFIVGREVWMTGVESFDQDAGDVLYYHWEERLRPINSQTADFVMQTSDLTGEPTVERELSVRLLVIPDVPGSYEVGLRVADDSEATDATHMSSLCQLFFEVDPDSEPCIASTSPDFVTGTLVFDRFDVRRLEVTQVTDDLDPFPGSGSGETDFLWQVEHSPGAGFVEIPGYGFPYLDIDGAEFSLNQRIRVRVVALDRADHDLSGCPVDLATCALGAGCFQWITWEIEFR
jgi:hypothetical protein